METNQNDRGAALLEYALIVALVCVACLAALQLVGRSAEAKYDADACSYFDDGTRVLEDATGRPDADFRACMTVYSDAGLCHTPHGIDDACVEANIAYP